MLGSDAEARSDAEAGSDAVVGSNSWGMDSTPVLSVAPLSADEPVGNPDTTPAVPLCGG